jgi:hypothetical protein
VATAVLPLSHWRRAAGLALLAVMAVDLFGAVRNPAARPAQDLSLYGKEADVLDYIHEHQGLDRSYLHGVAPAGIEATPKMATLWGLYAIGDYENLALDRQADFFAAFNPVVKSLGYYPLPFQGNTDIVATADGLDKLSLLSLRYFAVMQSDAEYGAILEESRLAPRVHAAPGCFAVFENPRPLPRHLRRLQFDLP